MKVDWLRHEGLKEDKEKKKVFWVWGEEEEEEQEWMNQ
jgi:hypothetical protein